MKLTLGIALPSKHKEKHRVSIARGMQDSTSASSRGVIATEGYYTGGKVETPPMENHEGHAEAVRIEFDPAKTSYEALLRFFFRMHDPTTPDRQGNDMFQLPQRHLHHDAEQQMVAQKVKDEVDASGKWKRPIVTEITPAGPWWRGRGVSPGLPGEEPGGYTCHWVRE